MSDISLSRHPEPGPGLCPGGHAEQTGGLRGGRLCSPCPIRVTQAVEEQPVPIAQRLSERRTGHTEPWAARLARALPIASAQEPEDGRACPQLRAFRGAQGTQLQGTQLAKCLQLESQCMKHNANTFPRDGYCRIRVGKLLFA